MISSQEIQQAYNDLYVEMRNYIWSFPVVNILAEFEIACYETCPDLDKVRKLFDALKREVTEVLREDDTFKDAFDAFESLVKDADEVYAKLYQVDEVMV